MRNLTKQPGLGQELILRVWSEPWFCLQVRDAFPGPHPTSHTHRAGANSHALCPSLKGRVGWENMHSLFTVVCETRWH